MQNTNPSQANPQQDNDKREPAVSLGDAIFVALMVVFAFLVFRFNIIERIVVSQFWSSAYDRGSDLAWATLTVSACALGWLVHHRQRLQRVSKRKTKAFDELKTLEIKRRLFDRRYNEVSLGLIGIGIVALAALVNMYKWNATVVTALVALAALWVGYRQFIDIRNEISIDKFYERLKITNEKMDKWPGTRQFASPWCADGKKDKDIFEKENNESYQLQMYVFLELDNLEYALMKYRAGYMSTENMVRSVRTFRARCASGD